MVLTLRFPLLRFVAKIVSPAFANGSDYPRERAWAWDYREVSAALPVQARKP